MYRDLEQDEAQLRAAAAEAYQQNKEALLKAVHELAYQCRASANACRIINSANLRNLTPAPTATAMIFGAINDLSLAGKDIEESDADRHGVRDLVGAVAAIFSLAATTNTNFAEALAERLHFDATTPIPF